MITSSTTTTGSPVVEREAAAQRHRAVLALGEQPAAAEGAGDLVGHEHAAEGGGHDRARRPRRRSSGRSRSASAGAEARGEGGVHEHARALQVARRVQPRGEEEVALQERPALLEEPQQGLVVSGPVPSSVHRRGQADRSHGPRIVHPAGRRAASAQRPATYTRGAMVPLSAVLIAQNEEKTHRRRARERRLLRRRSCSWTPARRDRTREIAEAAGARVIVNAPWPGFVAQRDFAMRAARHDWVLAARRRRAGRRGAARGDRGAAAAGLRRGRLPHPARGLVPRALDPRDRLVPRLAGAPLRPHAGRLAGRPRARVGGGARAGRAPARRARAPPVHRHLRPPAQDRLVHDAVGAAGPRAPAGGRTWSTWRRARPGPSSATTCSSAASCWAAPASSSPCSTRTTPSPSWPSCASSGARAPRAA